MRSGITILPVLGVNLKVDYDVEDDGSNLEILSIYCTEDLTELLCCNNIAEHVRLAILHHERMMAKYEDQEG